MRARSSKRWQAMSAIGLAAFLWGTPPRQPSPTDSRRPVPQGAVTQDADMASTGSAVRAAKAEATHEPVGTTRDTPVAGP